MKISIILYLSFILATKPGTVVFSFDEGPSRGTLKMSEKLRSLSISAVFHLVPEANFEKNIVDKLVEDGHSVGILISEDFLADTAESEVEEAVKNSLELFIKKTNFRPKLLRFSRSGWPEVAEKIAKKFELIVTRPNFDSEDIEKPYFMEFLRNSIKKMNPKSECLSIVFRDRFNYTLDSIEEVKNLFLKQKFKIVNYSSILNECVKPLKIFDSDKSETGENKLKVDENKILEDLENEKNLEENEIENEVEKFIEEEKRSEEENKIEEQKNEGKKPAWLDLDDQEDTEIKAMVKENNSCLIGVYTLILPVLILILQ